MKNRTMYIALVMTVAVLLNTVPVMAISNEEDTKYVKLSDIGINIPGEEDRIIPKIIADNLTKYANIDIQDLKTRYAKQLPTGPDNPDSNKKTKILMHVPKSGDLIKNGDILSSAAVIFSPNVMKFWNKTYSGDIIDARTVPDITGDKLDDAIALVYYPITHRYMLQAIKGNSGQILWSKYAPPGGDIYWDIVSDIDKDGIRNIILVISEPQIASFLSKFTVYLIKGNTGTNLWYDVTTDAFWVNAFDIETDLNGDGITDIIIEKNKNNISTFKSTFDVVAKKGKDGINLWTDSTSVQGYILGWATVLKDMNGDGLSDIIIQRFRNDYITKLYSYEVKAKRGKDGVQLWYDPISVPGFVFGFLYAGDLNKDSLTDVLIQRDINNTATKTESLEVKAKRGKDGVQLWRDFYSAKNGVVYNNIFIPWPIGDANGDGVTDFLFDIVNKTSSGSVTRLLKVNRGNDGVPVWQQKTTIPSGWVSGYTFMIGDITKDNFLDLFFTDYRKNPSLSTDYILYIKTLQAKNGIKLWDETIHGKLNQWKVLPYISWDDLNGDIYKDLIVEYDNFGNKTIKVKKSPYKTDLWTVNFTRVSGENLNIYPSVIQDITGDVLPDVFFDIERHKATSQSERLEARIGKSGTVKWTDSISGIVADFEIDYLGDANGDNIIDYIINGHNTSSTKKTYLYKIKNMKTGANLWSESLSSGVSATYGEMYACSAGDLKGNDKRNILKYANPASNSYSITAKMAPIGTYLWHITSNKDIEGACENVFSNFNGDLKDDLLFQTYRDLYAITTK